ncbi:MAG: GAF domain-containing protein [Desulfobacteraceae bacterium]|nr:MAG: GAF domain-containing protein [Desulfobacteraceae bacterium]
MKEKISMAFQDFSYQFVQGLSEIHRSLDLKETKEAAVSVVSRVFGAKGASLLLFDRTHETMKLSESFGLSEAYKIKGDVNPKKSIGETLHGNVVVIRDVATDPNLQYPQEALQEGIKSIVGLPVAVGNILVGTLRLYFDRPRDITWEEMEYLKMMALHVGLSLRKSFYFDAIKNSTTNIHLMPPFKVSESMLNLVKTATLSGNSMGCSLFLVKQSDGMLERVASFGLSENYLSKGVVSIAHSIGEVSTGKPVVVTKVATDPRIQYREQALQENIKAVIGYPVKVGSKIVGALRWYYDFEFEPDKDHLTWKEYLAINVGLAIEKNQLLIQLKTRQDWYADILFEMDAKPYNVPE